MISGCALLLLLAGCTSSTEGMGVPASSQPAPNGPRQMDDAGKELPFENNYLQRWNPSNDGTAYEPCTALTPPELAGLGIDAGSVTDAATVDGQSLRGCTWRRLPPAERDWRVAQILGNSTSIEQYKDKYRTNVWRPDLSISGRTVGVMLDSGDSCWTYVQSGEAGVLTKASYFSLPRKPYSELCDVAIDLTRATIDKIPK
ncbi:DUF3558 family protein [Gordonia sp. DT101]|uniref:DUF3558 family protein n=1 Tax=Gordonia sp. DT101 TaxID=3416545 RepID=UPI003CFB16DA